MSDLEKFQPELPARLIFARSVSQTRERQLGAALATLSLPDAEIQWLADNGEVYYLGQGSKCPDLYRRQSPKFPAQLWGADEVSLGKLGKGYYEDDARESVGMAVHLYRDGSPYVPDEIAEEILDPTNRRGRFAELGFMVVASHDGPPAMVHSFHEEMYSQEWFAYTPVITFEDVRSVRPDAIHYLDDNECSSLMAIVESAESFVDAEALVDQVEIWLRPFTS